MDDSDFDSELWVSGEELDYDEEDEIAHYSPRAESAAFFDLELSSDAETGGKKITFISSKDFHTRGKPGEIQREVATEFHGGRRKRPAFNVSAVAKAIIHGTLDQTSKTPATLLVYDFKFLSHRSTRIKDANISFEFKAKRGSTGLGPSVIAVAPYAKHIMMRTTETVTRTIGGDAGVQGGAVVAGNASVHAEKTVEKVTTHAAEVVGDNPADEWSNRFLAQWSLSENPSQMNGIVSLFRACIVLTRDNDEEFYLYPTVEVKPDLKTTLSASLWGFRRPDDPIRIVPASTAINRLEDKLISSSNLSSNINNLWDCTFYSTFDDAVKASRPRVITEQGAEEVVISTVKETKSVVS